MNTILYWWITVHIKAMTAVGGAYQVSLDFLMTCMCAKLLQSCLTLCDLMTCSPPGFTVHGILQARILEWVAMPSSRGSSWPRDRTRVSYVSCIGRRVTLPLGKASWGSQCSILLCVRKDVLKNKLQKRRLSWKSERILWDAALR